MVFRKALRVLFMTCSVAISLGILSPSAHGEDLPPAFLHAKAQFYLFLRDTAQATGITPQQNVVLNSTIMPFDIAEDTPFYNDELFREYVDRTFRGGVEGLQVNAGTFLSDRFSFKYRVVMEILTAQIDQNHPEIQMSLTDLKAQQASATNALLAKLIWFDQQWAPIAASRGLVTGSVEYNLQYATWLGQLRYQDQIQSYIADLDAVNAHIDAVRRKVYSSSEIAALENYFQLSSAYNMARPWTANIERSFKRSGTPLTELILANPKNLVLSMFDSSPLVLPVGDLIAFLSAVGVHSLDTNTYDYHLDTASSSWNASGGGSFLGFSLGGGGSGSSTITHSVSRMTSLSISFRNISEYLADRSAWFNPGVLQDPNMYKLVKDRPELDNLQYIGVSLIIARGTTLVLKFSDAVNASDWSQQAFAANGGVSFMGFSFGAQGGSSSSSYTVNVSSDGTTVTIQDGDKVARVLGARVEPFLKKTTPPQQTAHALQMLFSDSPALKVDLDSLRKGKLSYIEYQKKRLKAEQKFLEQHH
jgi:uncharacterized membrane protein YgcG